MFASGENLYSRPGGLRLHRSCRSPRAPGQVQTELARAKLATPSETNCKAFSTWPVRQGSVRSLRTTRNWSAASAPNMRQQKTPANVWSFDAIGKLGFLASSGTSTLKGNKQQDSPRALNKQLNSGNWMNQAGYNKSMQTCASHLCVNKCDVQMQWCFIMMLAWLKVQPIDILQCCGPVNPQNLCANSNRIGHIQLHMWLHRCISSTLLCITFDFGPFEHLLAHWTSCYHVYWFVDPSFIPNHIDCWRKIQ